MRMSCFPCLLVPRSVGWSVGLFGVSMSMMIMIMMMMILGGPSSFFRQPFPGAADRKNMKTKKTRGFLRFLHSLLLFVVFQRFLLYLLFLLVFTQPFPGCPLARTLEMLRKPLGLGQSSARKNVYYPYQSHFRNTSNEVLVFLGESAQRARYPMYAFEHFGCKNKSKPTVFQHFQQNIGKAQVL